MDYVKKISISMANMGNVITGNSDKVIHIEPYSGPKSSFVKNY